MSIMLFIETKKYGTEKKKGDRKGYLQTEPTPNMELFIEK